MTQVQAREPGVVLPIVLAALLAVSMLAFAAPAWAHGLTGAAFLAGLA